MSSTTGKNIKLSLFGESRGEGIGAVLDGLPEGFEIDEGRLARFLSRRAPREGFGSTPRAESDEVELLSGLYRGRTSGAPLALFIRNKCAKQGRDYFDTPRPSHCDYTARVRYSGFADLRGGGHLSGRLTAAYAAAGGICLQILEKHGIVVSGHVLSVGEKSDVSFAENGVDVRLLERLSGEFCAAVSPEASEEMGAYLEKIRGEGNSVGGVVECAALGLPAGIGSPVFDGVESRLSHAVFAIPGVKGVEFGGGFSLSRGNATDCRDEMYYDENGEVRCRTNNDGGLCGGITNGMPLVFRAAFKPVPSAAIPAKTVDLKNKTECIVETAGRNDVCIAVRALPVVEAATAFVLLDLMAK